MRKLVWPDWDIHPLGVVIAMLAFFGLLIGFPVLVAALWGFDIPFYLSIAIAWSTWWGMLYAFRRRQPKDSFEA